MRFPRVALWAFLAGLLTSVGACQSSPTPTAAPATWASTG